MAQKSTTDEKSDEKRSDILLSYLKKNIAAHLWWVDTHKDVINQFKVF